jgi:hypothetical protein
VAVRGGSVAKSGWARITDSVADVLRRGAWYPIVEETSDGDVVLDVSSRKIRLSRQDVHVRNERPERWSVVVRTGVLRPTLGGGRGSALVSTYGVCAYCNERQEFTGKPTELTCQKCGQSAPVDWTETC